jgi:serpin B
LIPILAAGCTSAGLVDDAGDLRAARALPEAARADVAALARGNNQFAVELYGQLARQPGNVVFSPFSVSTALAMVDAGAAGETDAELRAALHLPERAGDAYRALLASLAIGPARGGYVLATADRLFGQRGRAFTDGFLGAMRDDYGAALETVDFRDHDAARQTINTWVDGQTDHKIPELFQPGTISPDTVLALVNAIVFQGAWANKFDPGRTADGAFRLADGTAVQTPMMHRTGPVRLGAYHGAALGAFPFNGGDLSFIVLLPAHADGLPALEAALAADLADQIDAADPALGQEDGVEIAFPRLALDQRADLPTALQALGIVTAFDARTADLSGIDGSRDLVLDRVVHQAVLTVDEHGAEAAAATGGTVTPTSVPQQPPAFVVDHPFVFAIYDHVTHSILFLGRVSDPR